VLLVIVCLLFIFFSLLAIVFSVYIDCQLLITHVIYKRYQQKTIEKNPRQYVPMKVGLRPNALEELASPSLLMNAVVNV
jgi:hypothetical protein